MLQALLAGTEAAALGLSAAQLRGVAERWPRAHVAVEALRRQPGQLGATVQGATVALSTAAGALGAALWGLPLAATWPQLGAWAVPAGLAAVSGVVALACVACGDVLPTALALRVAPLWVAALGAPVAWVTRLARPLTYLLRAKGEQVARHRDGAAADLPEQGLAALQRAVAEAQRAGAVHPQAAEIAMRALTFGDLTVADVMVPRNRVHAIPHGADAGAIRRILLEEGHSCMPVYDGTLDQIVGVLVAKDVLALAWERELIVLDDLLHVPYFAPEIMRAADLLRELQRRRMHFAIAVDELGGTAGIVTVEDLLEELVGEIFGEHDADSPASIRREADGSILVQGSAPLRDVNRELALALPEGDTWSTVGGLCVSLAGRIPEVGNKLRTGDGTGLEVMDASQRRVRLVRLRLRPRPGDATRARGGDVARG